MGRKGRGGGGGQPPMKGFRPGKEPAHLRKQRAKAQLGSDASWAQKKMVDAVGDKSPAELEAMLKGWTTTLLIVAIVLAVVGVLLFMWSIIAGIIVHLLMLTVLFLWFRLKKQQAQIAAMTESMSRRNKK